MMKTERVQHGVDYNLIPDGLPEKRFWHGNIPKMPTNIKFSHPRNAGERLGMRENNDMLINSGSDYLFGLLVELAQCRDATSWEHRRLTQSCKEYIEELDKWIRFLDFKNMTRTICDSFGFGYKEIHSLATIRLFPIWMEYGLPVGLMVYDTDGIRFKIGHDDDVLLKKRPHRSGSSAPCPMYLNYGIVPIR